MKFDVVIGNPPYNNDLYLDFVKTGYEALKPDGVMVMITPAKWANKSGQTAKGVEANEKMRFLIRNNCEIIKYFPDAKDIFDISMSGISIFKITKEQRREPNNIKIICVRSGKVYLERVGSPLPKIDMSDIELSIFKKVCKDNLLVDSQLFKPTRSYNCKADISGDHSKPDLYQIGSGVFIVNSNNPANTCEINKKYVKYPDRLGEWALVSGGYVGDKCRAFIIPPNNVAIHDYTTLFAGTKEEVESAYSYYCCKLVWYFVACLNSGNKMGASSFSYVPDPGAFDHIFTDAELYQKYGLTQDEINIIESVIKEHR